MATHSTHRASLSITNSRSSPRLTSIESVMPSSHLILCRPLLLLPPIPPTWSPLLAARRAVTPGPGCNGTAEGRRSPRGCLVVFPRPDSPGSGPRRQGRPGLVAKLSLPPFPASPPEQKAGVSLGKGLSRDEPGPTWTTENGQLERWVGLGAGLLSVGTN